MTNKEKFLAGYHFKLKTKLGKQILDNYTFKYLPSDNSSRNGYIVKNSGLYTYQCNVCSVGPKYINDYGYVLDKKVNLKYSWDNIEFISDSVRDTTNDILCSGGIYCKL